MSISGVPVAVRGDGEVLSLLARRHAEGCDPRHRDGHDRVAVVVGGGGMRGAYAAGMLEALSDGGWADAVDVIYGASSGSFLAACFAAGHAGPAADSFPADLASRAFVDLRRLGRRPVLSLDHLVDHVLGVTRPMPWDALARRVTDVRIVATAVDDLRARVLDDLHTPDDWRSAFRASAAIPIFAGPPALHRGRYWIDGSIGEPLALARAVRDGATHVLVLLSRPVSELRPGTDPALSWWARALDRAKPGLGSLAQGTRRYGADLAMVTDPDHPGRAGVRVAAVEPWRGTGMGALTVDPGPVGEAVRVGRESMRAVMEGALRG